MFKQITKNEYKDLCSKALFTTFFHSIEFHEFLEKEFKWLNFEYYLYNDEAIIAFGRVRNKLISLPFCEYGGPLLLNENFNHEQFKKDIKEQFKENVKIKFYPRTITKESFDMCTHWLENFKNTSEQELWESLRKTLRHEIKNAQEHGLEIRASKSPKEAKKFYNLYVANLRRKRTVPYTWPLIQFLCQNSSSELLLAFYGGKIVGGALFLQYGAPHTISHYFLSAMDYKYHHLGIAHLILWEKIKSLINKDVVLDLGASPKGSALEIFKSGWGGTEYPIYQINLSVDGKEIKRTEESFRSSKFVRLIWGLLPNFAIKFLSPIFLRYRL